MEEGVFKYEFDPRLVDVLLESRVYAQLKKDVAFAFESKSALALYEVRAAQEQPSPGSN